MWFYNDSLHTGSICCQRNPFKAALASHVYYFLLLWKIRIFSFSCFLPRKSTLQEILLIFVICGVVSNSFFFKQRPYFQLFVFQLKLKCPVMFIYFILSFAYSVLIASCSRIYSLHNPIFFSSALLSLLVESQSARGQSLNCAVQLVRDCRPE